MSNIKGVRVTVHRSGARSTSSKSLIDSDLIRSEMRKTSKIVDKQRKTSTQALRPKAQVAV
jgi:hypothetical protein